MAKLMGAPPMAPMFSRENFGALFTLRAVRGRRSRPPCIASRALSRASPSRWMVNATRMVTIRASSHMPRMQAPITARLVSTWKPIWKLRSEPNASLNIWMPPIATPGTAMTGMRGPWYPSNSATITMISTGRAIPPPMRRHWSGRTRLEAALEYSGGRPRTDSNPSRLEFRGPPRW